MSSFLSTIFTKQHFVIDFVASLVIMLPCWCMVNILRIGDRIEKLENKIRLNYVNKRKLKTNGR